MQTAIRGSELGSPIRGAHLEIARASVTNSKTGTEGLDRRSPEACFEAAAKLLAAPFDQSVVSTRRSEASGARGGI